MGLLPIGRIKHIVFRRVTSRLRDWQVDVVKQPHGPVALHVAEGVVTTMGQQKYAVLMPLEAFLALLLSYQMVLRPLPDTTYTISSRVNCSGRVVSPVGISVTRLELTPSNCHATPGRAPAWHHSRPQSFEVRDHLLRE
jgi:hypothetical protein